MKSYTPAGRWAGILAILVATFSSINPSPGNSGEKAIFEMGSGRLVPVALTASGLDDLAVGRSAAVFRVTSGTRVRVTNAGFAQSEVQIDSGSQTGRNG